MLRINHVTRSRGRKTKDPCPGCALHHSLCICALMPCLDLKTKVSLVIHAKEIKRTTNTGRLAVRMLSNSEVYVRGQSVEPVVIELAAGYRPLLFFPSEEARELSSDLISEDSRPIQLIVPDGNWRQASKVSSRHPEIHSVERVKISTPRPLGPLLRAETSPEGMATLQAIAEALRILEGDEVYSQIMGFFQAKLQATLKGRGFQN